LACVTGCGFSIDNGQFLVAHTFLLMERASTSSAPIPAPLAQHYRSRRFTETLKEDADRAAKDLEEISKLLETEQLFDFSLSGMNTLFFF
jgi:hypothetical protein